MSLLTGICLAQDKRPVAKKNILVIHSYHEGLTWTAGENRGLKETFSRYDGIELFIEFLDSKRIYLDDRASSFVDYLSGKYRNITFDAIIVTDDNALTFIAECHNSLFPQTPVIFCGINDFKLEMLLQFNRMLTGVVQTLSPAAGTISLIQKLQPQLHRLFVVSGTSITACAIRKQAKRELAQIDAGLRVVWLDELDIETLCKRLSELSKNDAVLLCNFNRDVNGVYYSREESARIISRVSNAPVYAMADDYLGTGVVGGYVNSSISQGRLAAELCLEYLKTGKIPDVDMASPNRVMFDHRVMLRFGLDEGLLPLTAILINKPLSFYEQHKELIQHIVLAFILLLLAFLGVSYGLLHSRRSTRKLRINEENLSTTLDSIGDAVISTDTKGNVLRLNPVAQNLTGWRMHDACGRPLEDVFQIVNSITQTPAENPVDKVLESGEIVGLANHTELISRNGKRYQIADSAAPIKDADEKITGVVLVFRDVTDDYKIRRALQDSEKQYRVFAENSGDLIWTCKGIEDDFAFTYINPAVENVLGYTPEEYMALARVQRLDAESIALMDKIVPGMKRGDARRVDIRYIHKDGHLVDCELWAKPLFDENGEMTGFQGRTIDITERKRGEMRLAEINNCLVNLGPNYDDNVNALTVLCGRLLNATCALYNRLQGGLLCSLGQWNTPSDYISEDKPGGRLCYDLLHSGNSEPFVIRNLQSSKYARTDPNVCKYGLKTYVGYPALCAGEIVGALCVVYQDDFEPSKADLRILGIIASALAAEEDRRRAGDELRRMQKLEELGTVAGGIAHDFNNLLSGIFGNLELAQLDLPEDSEARPYIETAYKTIENARGLTGQLLTFATGGAPSFGVVDTAELVRKTVEFNLHGGSLRVNFDIQEGLWLIEADKGQIGQVIANLVTNARQAMPNGGELYVEACNLPADEQSGVAQPAKDMVRISIRDEGVGMPASLIDRIFDPYFTTKEKGHGLGLSVVSSIVHQHKGRIDVKSIPGIGTTFELYLPAKTEVEGATCSLPAPAIDDAEARSALRILVMDDEAVIRKLSEKMIVNLGHIADTASDGEETIAKYSEALNQKTPYDIVIMDLTIRGGMGGEETIKKLLEIDPAARVIVASGYASDPVMAKYNDYGFKGKMEKPYALKELKREIARVAGISA